MNDATTNADALPPDSEKDVLTDLLRRGATQLLAQAVQAEVAAYLEARSHLRDEAGRQQVVRHPMACELLGHWVSFVETRGAWSEYACRTCGHPFLFKRRDASYSSLFRRAAA